MSYIIVGLGNPGTKYVHTRHNAGRMAVELLHRKHNFEEWQFDKKSNALQSEGLIADVRVKLLMPETFMNKSGESLLPWIKYGGSAEKVIVLHDELDVSVGEIKISFNRSAGGHNGVESVIASLGTKEFTRVRIGIAPVSGAQSLGKTGAEFVLRPFKDDELEMIESSIRKSAQAVSMIIEQGREVAMGEYN